MLNPLFLPRPARQRGYFDYIPGQRPVFVSRIHRFFISAAKPPFSEIS